MQLGFNMFVDLTFNDLSIDWHYKSARKLLCRKNVFLKCRKTFGEPSNLPTYLFLLLLTAAKLSSFNLHNTHFIITFNLHKYFHHIKKNKFHKTTLLAYISTIYTSSYKCVRWMYKYFIWIFLALQPFFGLHLFKSKWLFVGLLRSVSSSTDFCFAVSFSQWFSTYLTVAFQPIARWSNVFLHYFALVIIRGVA